MPYSSVSELPASVKRGRDDKEQRQWMHVWNNAYKRCQDKKGDDCEGSAYRQANGTAKKKELEDTWEIWGKQLSQASAGYDSMGGVNNKEGRACANCNWFASPDGCILVQGDISPTGISNHWQEKIKYEPEPIPVIVVGEKQKSIVDRIKSYFTKQDDALRARAIPEGGVFQFKQLDASGEERTRVMMRVTNHFKDRHGEIITTEAHKEYERYVDETGEYPEFWLWHIPGSRWGQADFVSYADGFLTVSGLVDKGYEQVAEKLASRKDIGVSHGFYGLSLNDDSQIDVYRTFECSPLPLDEAANQWNPLSTIMTIAKEAQLPIPQAKRDFAIKDLGIPESVLDTWERENKDFGEGLREHLGIAYKSKEEPEPKTKEEGEPVATPATAPASAPVATTGFTLEDIRAAIRDELKPTQDAVAALEEKQKAYEGGLQHAVSQVITNGVAAGKEVGFDPTASPTTKSNEQDAKADEDWFEKVVARGETY